MNPAVPQLARAYATLVAANAPAALRDQCRDELDHLMPGLVDAFHDFLPLVRAIPQRTAGPQPQQQQSQPRHVAPASLVRARNHLNKETP